LQVGYFSHIGFAKGSPETNDIMESFFVAAVNYRLHLPGGYLLCPGNGVKAKIQGSHQHNFHTQTYIIHPLIKWVHIKKGVKYAFG